MTDYSNNRMTEITDIYHRFADVYRIGGGLLLVLIGVWIGSLIFADGYATNVYTEMLSIFVTVLVLDRLNEWRSVQQRKRTLVREAASRDNSTALNAIDWLRAEGWLTEYDETPLLKEIKLSRADLHNAYLYGAHLQNTNLYKVNLSYADLSKANVVDSFLHRAILQYTSLYETDFRQTNLWDASLRGAKYIETVQFDEKTILPDAQPLRDDNGRIVKDDNRQTVYDKYWTPDTDMTRYTNPKHPDFWEPEWVHEGGQTS